MFKNKIDTSFKTLWVCLDVGHNDVQQWAVALMVGSVPRRIVPKLCHFHWLLKIDNHLN